MGNWLRPLGYSIAATILMATSVNAQQRDTIDVKKLKDNKKQRVEVTTANATFKQDDVKYRKLLADEFTATHQNPEYYKQVMGEKLYNMLSAIPGIQFESFLSGKDGDKSRLGKDPTERWVRARLQRLQNNQVADRVSISVKTIDAKEDGDFENDQNIFEFVEDHNVIDDHGKLIEYRSMIASFSGSNADIVQSFGHYDNAGMVVKQERKLHLESELDKKTGENVLNGELTGYAIDNQQRHKSPRQEIENVKDPEGKIAALFNATFPLFKNYMTEFTRSSGGKASGARVSGNSPEAFNPAFNLVQTWVEKNKGPKQ